MNLDQIETKCFILALFIRDDGERFLLGSRAFEFKDSQLHFVANTYQNDVVEVQGNDGIMLAGQVRRGSSQPFDGYIGDGSVSRSMIEQYRRQFFQFFRKNHYYTVVYIMPDKSAIQRRKGFIVDAPEVKELYQLFPEYHIAMNFEDINYYNYEENSDGQEIFGESVDLKMGTSAQGGLIWGNQGQSSTSGEGTSFTLYNTIDGGSISDVKIKGATSQQTYSGKNIINNYSPTIVDTGITWTPTPTGGIFTRPSGVWGDGVKWRFELEVGKTYTLKFSSPTTAALWGAIRSYTDNTYTTVKTAYGNDLRGNITKTFIADSTYNELRFTNSDTVNSPEVSNLQLEEGSTPTSYEPYVGGIPAPNPDYPQEVQVVTGEQTVTISDGNSQSQTYTIDLGSIELCKIGDYQDYIYKSGDDWYVHKAIKKLDVSSLTGWFLNNNTNFRTTSGVSDLVFPSDNNTVGTIMSDHFIANTANNLAGGTVTGYGIALGAASYISIRNKDISTLAAFTTYLANNQIYAYVALATPTDTQITDATLISELNDLSNGTVYDAQTSFAITSANQVGILSVTADAAGGGGVIWDEIGAVWEIGSGGGPVTVSIDSIDNVYPVWELTGPVSNPELSILTTNTTLQYTGSVTASQTLRIDMFNKTATLNGASVVGNISGDWVYLQPGINRITYVADNADAPNSTLWWQEIIG